ncbi:hypothetical protein COR50_02010 [Chitinophaga caeni]|uniref:Uncharacterized protein n=1 Tax=Chitinophaga caeni TaxID=2029983 RepID=A0A291QQ82_9BACT|nr:hypothetical protein [Chitinophaga caeni]ATL46032.1 hypothetical protein COR50_02010 [Chitinophaga caeni]
MKILRNSLAAIIALFAVGATIASQAKVSAVPPTQEGCFESSSIVTDPIGWTAPTNTSGNQYVDITTSVVLDDFQAPLEIDNPVSECLEPQQTVCCYELKETSPNVFEIKRVYYKQNL